MFSLQANAAVVAVTAGGNVLSIDESNGTFSTIGPTGFDPLNCLAANSGGTLFSTTDKAEVQRRKREYYDIIGWDAHGIPTSQVLRKLGLDTVDTSLQQLREA